MTRMTPSTRMNEANQTPQATSAPRARHRIGTALTIAALVVVILLLALLPAAAAFGYLAAFALVATVPLGGTSVSFGGVPPGTYFLRMTATNAVGTSPLSNQVTLVVP